jgi:hypothetical protein
MVSLGVFDEYDRNSCVSASVTDHALLRRFKRKPARVRRGWQLSLQQNVVCSKVTFQGQTAMQSSREGCRMSDTNSRRAFARLR